jgi:hypothetical protein
MLPALAHRRLLGMRPEMALAHIGLATALPFLAAHALARPG